MNRRLTLKAEHLTPLTDGDLAAVAGGRPDIPTVDRCLTGMYPSINMPCPTIDEPCVEVAIRQTLVCTV